MPARTPGEHLARGIQQQHVLGAQLQPTRLQPGGQRPVEGQPRAHLGKSTGQQQQQSCLGLITAGVRVPPLARPGPRGAPGGMPNRAPRPAASPQLLAPHAAAPGAPLTPTRPCICSRHGTAAPGLHWSQRRCSSSSSSCCRQRGCCPASSATQGWKRSAFIPILKKVNAKECSNYCTIALI